MVEQLYIIISSQKKKLYIIISSQQKAIYNNIFSKIIIIIII